MSDEIDPQLDDLLSGHLAAQLDPQRGRTLRAFEAEVAPRPARVWLRAASIGLLFMTSAALALWSMHAPRAAPNRVVHKTTTTAPDRAAPRDVEQLVAWQASDEGFESVLLQDRLMPVRKVRREAVETTQWFDPASNATMRLTVPVEQVILVQEDRY